MHSNGSMFISLKENAYGFVNIYLGADDHWNEEQIGVVPIEIRPVNDLPVILKDSLSISPSQINKDKDESISIEFVFTDRDNEGNDRYEIDIFLKDDQQSH